MFDIAQLSSVQIGLASPDEIRSWSHGEVTKAETINYRSQKPEPAGLFCEKIFGPSKDYECHCGKYKKIRYQGITCEKCGVEVISKEFRRERMGHIELACPCTHIWYLKGMPSRIFLVLDIPAKQLEEIVYFAAHVCTNPGKAKFLKYKEFIDEKTARGTDPEVVAQVSYDGRFPVDEDGAVIDTNNTNPQAKEIEYTVHGDFVKEIEELVKWVDETDEAGNVILDIDGAPMRKYVGVIDKDSYDYVRAHEIIKKMLTPNETFDFQTAASFISKYTGAEFGEGAEAIKQLLSEVKLDAEIASIKLQLNAGSKAAEILSSFKKTLGENGTFSAEALVNFALDVKKVELIEAVDAARKLFEVADYKDFLKEDVVSEEVPSVSLELNEEEVSVDSTKRIIEDLAGKIDSLDLVYKYNKLDIIKAFATIGANVTMKTLDNAIEDAQSDSKGTTANGNKAKLAKRLETLSAFKESNQKPEWMVLDVVPVIPPDLRPMLPLDGGRYAASDMNDLYRRVIHRNTTLRKLIDMRAPYVIMMNEKRMLQEAVDALIDNGRRSKPVTGPSGRALKSLSSGLKGKQGRFRQNLLGKRVDYSGRSVIAVGPDLKMYQCGLPREMAVQLLRPFIAAVLIKEQSYAHRQADKVIDRYDPIVFDIVERIISDHPVLLNRAPTLHRLGIQAFQPKLVDGRAIRLHPLVCTGFNADFDGDQMAVHVPLSKAAQKEALELMLASNNILGPKDGEPIAVPSQDMVLGNYHLTVEETSVDFAERAAACRALAAKEEANKDANLLQAEQYDLFAESEGKVFGSTNEALNCYVNKQLSLHNRILIPATAIHKDEGTGMPEGSKGKYLITTVGKLIFNQIFPDDFPYINDQPKKEEAAVLEQLKPSFVSAAEVEAWAKENKVPAEENPIKAYVASLAIHKPITKKELKTLIALIFKHYGTTKTSAVLDKIKDQGFRYSTVSAVTIAISDITPIEGKSEKVDQGYKDVEKIEACYEKGFLSVDERHKKIVAVWTKITNAVRDDIKAHNDKDKRNPLVIMADSGARGNLDNFKQLIGMKGLVANPKNEEIELPVVSSYRQGVKVSEFFINTHGARKGGADTALKTADSGYLTRRLVDVSQDVIVREVDCGCDHGFRVREIRDTSRDQVIEDLKTRLIGRYSMHDIINPTTNEVIVPANTLMNEDDAKKVVAAGIKEVEIRSLFTCQTKNGVCQHCYGQNMATGKLVAIGDAVGIMAAQSIGEPGTQLTMRVFHTGGMAGSDITQGLPRVQELVEARNPKGEALISAIAGTVHIEKNGSKTMVVVSNDIDNESYEIAPGSRLRVNEGDSIEAGGKITEGAIPPKKLLEVSDVEKVEVYMIKEIKKVYAAQGIGISDKHLEIIVRQMLRRVAITDSGDTDLLVGTRRTVEQFTEANTKALLRGGRPAVGTPIVLGITQAARESDSFLSAASFQETTRILTQAAIEGKLDPLHGLKENVITGRLIPAGTGLRDGLEDDSLADFTVEGKMREVKQQYIEKHDRQEIEK
ncbi:MAG: DNA-directed RNA polymerase subunit beta' [Bacilli bacterium]|nr:DNA-directed RNA polymerase subunit beta' [Bacilli bacterium]